MNGKAPQEAAYAQNSETSPSRVDEATLKRAAAAYVKVRDISVKAEQEINSTDDTARKQQLMDESDSEKVAAVKDQGIEPQLLVSQSSNAWYSKGAFMGSIVVVYG